jgi:hypothetical protein
LSSGMTILHTLRLYRGAPSCTTSAVLALAMRAVVFVLISDQKIL